MGFFMGIGFGCLVRRCRCDEVEERAIGGAEEPTEHVPGDRKVVLIGKCDGRRPLTLLDALSKLSG